MNEIKIEKNMPLAPSRGKYPFSKMEIGDSFSVPKGKNISGCAASFGLRNGMEFRTATEGDNTRCWRTK